MKRLLDFIGSFLGLVLLSPFLLLAMLLVWLQDFHSPFYVAARVGKNGRIFNMVKLRSMVIGADKTGVDSTSRDDPRITVIGRFVRGYKLDEFTQLWNVLLGDMSLVGPRPNVKRETDLYTEVEKGLLKVRPGITDFSSIVFSDEGEILKDAVDPDIAYNQLIRPWKSRLGLIYVENRSLLLDIKLILLTIVAILSSNRALKYLNIMLNDVGAPEDVVVAAKRESRLVPTPPPGSDSIVTERN